MTAFRDIRLADGFRVHAPHLLLDDIHDTIITLHMLGSEQAVKANWSALMQGSRVNYISGTRIKLSGSKHHITMRKILPCGWLEMWLIHKQASYTEMTPTSPFYITTFSEEEAGIEGACPEPAERVPDTFFMRLDRAIPTPILPHWSHWLWKAGIDHKLIYTAAYGPDRHNMYAWRVNPDPATWGDLISMGIKQKHILL